MMKRLQRQSVTKKIYSLHFFFKPTASKEQIEKDISGYIKQIIMENDGEKVYEFENHGKVELCYVINKNTSANHYSWSFDIKKSFIDMFTENLGTRLMRIQRKIKEKFNNQILRLVLLS